MSAASSAMRAAARLPPAACAARSSARPAAAISTSGRPARPTSTCRPGSGGIEISGARRALRARAGSGTIDAEGRPTGSWDVETGSGGVRIDLPGDAALSGCPHRVRWINTTHPLAGSHDLAHSVERPVRGGGARVNLFDRFRFSANRIGGPACPAEASAKAGRVRLYSSLSSREAFNPFGDQGRPLP